MTDQFRVPSSSVGFEVGSSHLEGKRMRQTTAILRTSAILTVCFCAVAGCQGGAAQEPYDGAMVAVRHSAVAAPVAQTPEPEIASEIDVPWAIALLSDAKAARVRKPGKVVRVETEPDVSVRSAEDADLQFAIDPRYADEKPATPKACSGVVKSRS
jgi:hypothetical protein